MSARKWFSRLTTKKGTSPPPASPNRKRRLWVVLVGVVLAGWSLRSVVLPTPSSSSPLSLGERLQSVPTDERPAGEQTRQGSVPTGDRPPVIWVVPTPTGNRPPGEQARQGSVPIGDRPTGERSQSIPALVPSPPQQNISIDPFQAYQQIVGTAAPRAVPTPRRLATQTQTLPPPPVAPLPVLPPPPTVPALAPSASKPRSLTLRERLRASGWTVLAVGMGAEPVVLLSRRGEQGLYRVGETLEERIRIERIQGNRVILARNDERVALEVLP